GTLVRSTEGEINDLPINSPMIDINTVGAGGGSIAWIDEGGALRVGPKSSGADPGPICYGRGGERPTVTDANLLLGRINPETFLDGEMQLAVDRTREIFDAEIADPLGQSVEAAALSVVDVANASLAREIRRVTVERGTDPESFALVAFGGAGPLQAPETARRMDMNTVIVPQNPGVFSARGLLIADVRVDESHSYRGEGIDAAEVRAQFDELVASLRRRTEAQGFDDPAIERAVDVRYAGQSYELTVDVPAGPIDGDALEAAVRAFHRKHERIYGYAIEDEPVEIVTLRANSRVRTAPLSDSLDVDAEASTIDRRDVYFADRGFVQTDVYRREQLPPGTSVTGPAIVEEHGCTSILPPETSMTISEHGSMLIDL
ncbi:MAG: hydantoinase/oxoprolinase family protein, partial [Halobacteriota archaeon]